MIGPKGNAINEILQDTGVFVEMPSSDSTSETITLRGPQEKLGLGEFQFKCRCICEEFFENKPLALHASDKR